MAAADRDFMKLLDLLLESARPVQCVTFPVGLQGR